jgi:hypothetical protein
MFANLFYDAFSVTKLYSVDDKSQVNDDEQTRTNIHAWGGIWTHGLSDAITVYASDRAATVVTFDVPSISTE